MITVDVPVRLGRLTLDNGFSYTLSGPGQLTMDVPAGQAEIVVVNGGSHTIALPVKDPFHLTRSLLFCSQLLKELT